MEQYGESESCHLLTIAKPVRYARKRIANLDASSPRELQASCCTAEGLYFCFACATGFHFADRRLGSLDLFHVFWTACISCNESILMLKQRRAYGSANIEVLVAASLLIAVIGLLSSMVPRLGNVWKASRNNQLATHELANQLELLTAIPELQLSQALENLRVSPDLTDALHNAVLRHQLLDDASGRRIVLSIDWERTVDAKPISMVAWLPSQKTGGELRQESDTRGTP